MSHNRLILILCLMNKKVLLIDDDPMFQLILSRMIEKVGIQCDVSSYSNGKLALDYLNEKYSPQFNYLMFLDINMPVMSGWEFLDQIKPLDMIRNNNMTINIVTSSTDLSDAKKAGQYDFIDGIISKPVSFDKLNAILRD